MSKIALYLLGQPRLEVDGASVAVNTRKAIALIAYLAVTGQNHSREALDALLWPDSTPRKARAALRTTLSILKKALNDEWLVAERKTVGLDDTTDVWVDVVQFRHLLAESPGDDCARQLDPLSRAVDLYQGDFMAGFSLRDSAAFDEWQFFQAEALRRDLATALEQLVICLKTREDYETAIGHARRWLSLDPLHEPAHCQLMELYELTGQHSAALRQYQECVRLLKQELGLPPQYETTALYQRLRLGTESRHLIADRYTCRRQESDLLGQGSMGQVYREIDTETGQAVAVKILKPEFVIQQPDLVERFNREGEALRQLNHPNIIKLLATAEEDGQQFLVMEYAAGGSLRDLLKRETPLPVDRVLQIAIELSDALTQTHYRGIIHRDLKPGNVLLDQDGTPRLTDFGVAHLVQAERLTQTGMAIGTLDYLAPEALSGERVDARGDIWSLGVLLFEMLAQQRPFPGHTPTEVLTAILTQPSPDLATRRPDLPPALVSLVSRMLVKDSAERIASARLVGAELEAIMQGRKGVEELGRRGGSVVSPFPPRPPAPQPPSNLPVQTTPFIGRERELTELTRLLTDSACRLVTLSGPGGIGKTRLAIKAAQNFIDASPDKPTFSHGVYFVPLEMVSSPGFLVSAIADAIGFVFYSDIDLRQQLLDYLREKEMLLILDNFEHLLEGVDLLADILTTAPVVKLLVTSIETLNLHEEWYYSLEGLTFPEDETIDQAALDEYSAVQLFVQSAQRAQPGFSLSSEQACVIRICRLVEGVPLGIELAVVWLKAFTCERIAQEIERSIDFLATTQRNVPGRHQSIRAIFEYSWQLLSENEKSILRRLSVFGGGFRAEAAQQISGASLAILMALVEKSLLRPSPGERYQMPKLLKQFTAEKLEAVPRESAKTQDRHSDYYLNFLHQRKEAITGKYRSVTLMELGEEIENIQAAWNRAIEQGQVAMIDQALSSFYTLCRTRSWFWEGQEAFEEAVQYLQSSSQEPGSEAMLGRLQARLGAFCLSIGQFEAAKKLLQESLAIANRLNNASEIAFSLNFLGQVTEMQGDVTEARRLFFQGLANSQEAGDQAAVAIFLKNLGSISITYLGTYQEASRYLKESLAISRELERQDLVSDCLHTLGYTCTLLGEYAQAEPYCRESLAIFDEAGDRFGKAMAIGGLGLVAEGLGGDRLIEAKSYCEERVALCREIGVRLFIAGSLATLGRINNGLGAYHEAIDCGQEALTIAKEIGNPWKATEALSALGEAASGLGDHKRAKQHLREGLQIAIEPGAIPYLLEALGILAAIFTAENGLIGQERRVHAVEVLTMVIHHPASWDIVKQKAARHLADIEVELPQDVVVAAKARGQARDLQETVAELLEVLADPDWIPLIPSSPPLPSPPTPQQLSNLPAQTTSFIGRETDLADLARLLADPQVRLLTILGPGGMGKTRLALEVAEAQLEHFEDGVYLVRLAPLVSAESIVSTTAEALGFQFYEGGTPEQQLLDYLRQKQILLLMDNFEHLLDGVPLLAAWLEAAPSLKILATSRARLNMQGEHLFPLRGLNYPKDEAPTNVARYSSMTLFLQSARRIRPNFELSEENRADVAQICRLVEGMPLGLLLAASWVELLIPAEIVEEIARSLDFLETGLQDLPQRQRSLRAVLDHSWNLLSQREQDVLGQLSVFRGGFSRKAAQAVAGASLRNLMALVNRSLLHRISEVRLEVHELLRQYAAEKLVQSPQTETTAHQRHSAYYLAFLRQRETSLTGGQQKAALDEISGEIENIRAAWDWAVAQGDMAAIDQALQSLYDFYHLRSWFYEGREAFGKVAKHISPPKMSADVQDQTSQIIWAKILARQGAFCESLGLYEPASDLVHQALMILRRLNMQQEIAFSLDVLGEIAEAQGDYLSATALYQESLTISREMGYHSGIIQSLEHLSANAHMLGKYEEAKVLAQESLAICRKIGNQALTARSLDRLGTILFIAGSYPEAEQSYRESFTIFKEIGDQHGIAMVLGGLGWVAWALGGERLVEAHSLYVESLTICREIGHRSQVTGRLSTLGRIANSMGAYDEAQQYCQEGLAISREVGYSLGIINNLGPLGYAACGQADFRAARTYLREAFQTAADTHLYPRTLELLVYVAELFVREKEAPIEESPSRDRQAFATKEKELAVEFLALVFHHPACWQIYKDMAARLLEELEPELPPEIVAAAQARGRARDLESTVAELVVLLREGA